MKKTKKHTATKKQKPVSEILKEKGITIPKAFVSNEKDKIRKAKASLPEGCNEFGTTDIMNMIHDIPKNSYIASITLVKFALPYIDSKTFRMNNNFELVYDKSKVTKLSQNQVYSYALHKVWSFIYLQKTAKEPVIKNTGNGVLQVLR